MQKMEIGQGGADEGKFLSSSSGYNSYRDGPTPVVGTDTVDSNDVSCPRICCGIIYVLIGLCLGMVTFIPNAMMSDSGTGGSLTAANIGMLASLSFAVGGIVAAVTNRCYWLLVGVVLQLLAFLVLTIVTA